QLAINTYQLAIIMDRFIPLFQLLDTKRISVWHIAASCFFYQWMQGGGLWNKDKGIVAVAKLCGHIISPFVFGMVNNPYCAVAFFAVWNILLWPDQKIGSLRIVVQY